MGRGAGFFLLAVQPFKVGDNIGVNVPVAHSNTPFGSSYFEGSCCKVDLRCRSLLYFLPSWLQTRLFFGGGGSVGCLRVLHCPCVATNTITCGGETLGYTQRALNTLCSSIVVCSPPILCQWICISGHWSCCGLPGTRSMFLSCCELVGFLAVF